MKTHVQFPAAVVVALMMVGIAQATVIWSDGFENPATVGPYGGVYYLSDWIEQWGHLPADHVFKPTGDDFDLPLPWPAGGEQILWISQNGNWAARSGGTIAANTAYTLSAAVGDINCEAIPFWRLQLWAGDVDGPAALLAEVAHDSSGANSPADRGWALNAVTFDSTYGGHVGETLWARLYMDPRQSGADPGEFDNVVLQSNASPIPEPGTWAMLLVAVWAILHGRGIWDRI